MSIEAVLVASGELQEGIAAALSTFVYKHGGEILDFDQYVDMESSPQQYFGRVSWSLDNFDLEPEQIADRVEQGISSQFDIKVELHLDLEPTNIAILVTHEMPCLYGLSVKCLSREWNARPALILSNREDLAAEAKRFDIPFYHLPITAETREQQGEAALEIFAKHSIGLIVLAKYMQIVPPNIVQAYKQRIINIHHSMLPAFVGARPYHQAREFGVKFIGATAHPLCRRGAR